MGEKKTGSMTEEQKRAAAERTARRDQERSASDVLAAVTAEIIRSGRPDSPEGQRRIRQDLAKSKKKKNS